jgi:hypothetical protein
MKDKCSKSLAKAQGHGSMITKTQGVHLVRVRDATVVLRTDGLGTNMVRLVSNKVWPRGRLMMARLRPVVAMRLHAQLSSFQLCNSSNTPSCSEEGHDWDPFANPIRHALSILQLWLEKHLWELAQFKERLQFRRAHQPDKPTFNKLHPRSTTSIARTQRPSKSLPT